VEVLVIPSRVQGAEAAGEIADAIAVANRLTPAPDVLVLTRGGGSLEDLWCFNDERVIRAIFNSRIPVVSAVGHEIDVTLSDMAADVRALTPSEAAELVVPSADDAREGLRHLAQRMAAVLRSRTAHARTKLEALAQRRALRRPDDRIHDLTRRVDELELRTHRAMSRYRARTGERIRSLAGQLDSLSPLAVLGRGYSVTKRVSDGAILRVAEEVAVGESIRTQLSSGELVSRIERVVSDTTTTEDGQTASIQGVMGIDEEKETRP
jgi:exodeoxyribonuclease VII large subunit